MEYKAQKCVALFLFCTKSFILVVNRTHAKFLQSINRQNRFQAHQDLLNIQEFAVGWSCRIGLKYKITVPRHAEKFQMLG